jgi:hypothetical protein
LCNGTPSGIFPLAASPMTTRERLNRIRKRGVLLALGFAAVAVIAGLLSARSQTAPVVAIIAGALALSSVNLSMWLGHCSKCRKRVGPAFLYRGTPIRISRDFRFCPYCGVSIDQPGEQ